MRILFAEDEADLNRILTKRLAEEGYSVDSYRNGVDALDAMLTVEYDGAILDIMMPGADGFSVLSAMRSRGLKTPVLFLTARDSVEDRVRGLDAGAADYLVKPFAMEELLARVRALLRRGAGEEHSFLTCGDLVLDLTGHTVSRGGEEIPLSAKEYALLEYLLYNKNRILSREMIEDHIWNYDYEGGTNVVDVYVSYLRRKIDDGRDAKLIRTVRGRGYQIKDPED
ncbi:MAG: response regulator transcription factor [Clostridiales bacterium]|nr:response regulator transcription factor [Clostridiales bacterium]